MLKNGTIIIVADQGELKAFRVVVTEGIDPHETMQVSHVNLMNTEKTARHLELVTDRNYVGAHRRVHDEMSDTTGRLGERGKIEPHNMLLEKERKALEAVAKDINELIGTEKPEAWRLAFPKENNAALTEMLDDAVRKSLESNLAKDLTKVSKEDLLAHFE